MHITMTWKLGSNPEAHPLWQEQVELELRMVDRGAEKYRERRAKAIDKEEMTALRPYRRVLEDMVTVAGAGVHSWINGTHKALAKRGGATPIAYTKVKGLDPYLCAYITARTVLDRLGIPRKEDYETGTNHMSYMSMAREVGQSLEYEARMKEWLEAEPALLKDTEKKLKNQKATAKHRKRVNINVFNRVMRSEVQWRNWSPDEKLHTGFKMLDILARATGHIQIIPDPTQKRKSIKSPPYVIVASDELLQYLMERIEDDETKFPQYLPTVMPPKRWTGVRRGGYYTPMVTVRHLIRFKADNEEVQGVAADEYDSLDMPQVYQAINTIQEVPWRINKRVLEVAHEAWERDMAIGKLAKREPIDLPARPAGQQRIDLKGEERRRAEQAWIDANPDVFREWRREAAKVYGENARRVSNAMATRTTLEIADLFIDREFYFPHMLDFRGRMYPIPVYLQPQGNDLARGLLTFAQGKPVGDGGLAWLAINVANCWGYDKVSYDDRIQWAYDNWDMFARIAAHPLGNLEWTQVDNPWQTLAAIFEFVRIGSSENPAGEVSALPVRVDGTCNGIQHLSAMMRDEVGGASVNLLPSDKPRDIYQDVADILLLDLVRIEASGGKPGFMASKWLDSLPDRTIDRSFTKRPVMVTPYGGTRESYKVYTLQWLEKHRGMLEEDRWDATIWMVPHLWDAVAGRVVKARECMEWLKKCADLVADTGAPIWWTTKTGFHVRHFYAKLKKRRIETQIDGKSVWVVDYERTKDLSKKDQLQGISPNYVHSQDACVNMETIIDFVRGHEPPPFTTIHDSFGTVAGCMWDLFRCIREAFIKVHDEDVLDQFRQRCVLMLRDHYMATRKDWSVGKCWETAEDMVPPVPAKGQLNLEEVRDADYFFA